MRDIKFWKEKLILGVRTFFHHKNELAIAERNYKAYCKPSKLHRRDKFRILKKRTMWHSKLAFHKRELERISKTKLAFYEQNIVRLGGEPMLERMFLNKEIERLQKRVEEIKTFRIKHPWPETKDFSVNEALRDAE